MAIITSWAVGVDSASNRPAASTSGRLFVNNNTGAATTYLFLVDDGANWQPVRSNFAYPLRAVFQTGDAWTVDPGGAGTYQSFGGASQANLHMLDFTRFREGRITARAKCRATASAAISIKLVDTTNSHDIGSAVSFTNDGNWYTHSSSWGSLNSATYGGDAVFELQGLANANTDIIDIGTVILELR